MKSSSNDLTICLGEDIQGSVHAHCVRCHFIVLATPSSINIECYEEFAKDATPEDNEHFVCLLVQSHIEQHTVLQSINEH